MVPDSDGDIHRVHELTHVVGVHAVHGEGNDTDAINVRVGAENPDAIDRRDAVEHHGRERVFVCFHAIHTERRHVAQRLRPGCDLSDGLRACFKTLGRCHEGRFLHGDPFDHGATGEDRWHRREERPTSPQCTGTRGAEHLVRGEHREVNVEL